MAGSHGGMEGRPQTRRACACVCTHRTQQAAVKRGPRPAGAHLSLAPPTSLGCPESSRCFRGGLVTCHSRRSPGSGWEVGGTAGAKHNPCAAGAPGCDLHTLTFLGWCWCTTSTHTSSRWPAACTTPGTRQRTLRRGGPRVSTHVPAALPLGHEQRMHACVHLRRGSPRCQTRSSARHRRWRSC